MVACSRTHSFELALRLAAPTAVLPSLPCPTQYILIDPSSILFEAKEKILATIEE
jgi:hypothetical protein